MLAKYKRRKPGVYLYRTFRHMRPGTEWGYAGKSRNLDARALCHAGTCHHVDCLEKFWHDLIVFRWTLRLPWWLGWDWITLSLETLLILVTGPRYNWQKNPWSHKVGPRGQAQQRAQRDLYPRVQSAYRKTTLAYNLISMFGIIIILVGIGGYVWTR